MLFWNLPIWCNIKDPLLATWVFKITRVVLNRQCHMISSLTLMSANGSIRFVRFYKKNHHWRPGLYEMQGYKLAAAKRLQKQLKGYNLENVVLQLMRLEYRIRACYHKYLDFSGKTLAWMIAVDASFLLEFLQVYAIQEKELPCRVSSRMSHLVDFAGTKPAHNAILRDIVMLENQIPLFVLRKMLEVKFSSESGDDLLVSMLMGLHNELSPFNVSEDLPSLQVSRCSHLLDFLYEMIVPKLEETTDQVLEIADDNDLENENSSSSVKRLQSKISDLVSKWTDRLVPMLKKVMLSRPSKAVVKLPWTILSNLCWRKLKFLL